MVSVKVRALLAVSVLSLIGATQGDLQAQGVTANAPPVAEWENPQINEINRLPMRTSFMPYEDAAKSEAADPAASQRFLSL